MNVLDFKSRKRFSEKITMVTCYDYTSAKLIADTEIDGVLVGDSVAMTMYGYKNTLAATVDMMCMHTQGVSRGIGDKFVVSDLPFLSYRKSLDESIDAVQKIMQSGAHAVKLECADGNLELIRHLTESGVPVMGHLGLTPQLINTLGGYKVQGKSHDAAEKLIRDAVNLQEAGCFALVLECVPNDLATSVTQALDIPTIGIGAGKETDGQILVWQDLLGLNQDFKPKFVKNFIDGFSEFKNSINHYVHEVRRGEFPGYENSFENR